MAQKVIAPLEHLGQCGGSYSILRALRTRWAFSWPYDEVTGFIWGYYKPALLDFFLQSHFMRKTSEEVPKSCATVCLLLEAVCYLVNSYGNGWRQGPSSLNRPDYAKNDRFGVAQQQVRRPVKICSLRQKFSAFVVAWEKSRRMHQNGTYVIIWMLMRFAAQVAQIVCATPALLNRNLTYKIISLYISSQMCATFGVIVKIGERWCCWCHSTGSFVQRS